VTVVSLTDLTAYLDRYLRIAEVPDEPNAVNGLQVENRSAIGRIVAAVDASLETISAAVRQSGRVPGIGSGARSAGTLLLVHHGLFWDGNIPITGRRHRKVRALLEQDIALYSAHIPLDIHPEVGNNAVLARQLGLTSVEPWDTYRGIPIGARGSLAGSVSRDALVARVEQLLGGGCHARLIPGGPEVCQRIGIITGGAGNRIGAAHEADLDTFITGEGAHHTYFDAMELGVNAIYAGHYATETVGVKALAAHLSERFGVPWEFHDHPTGL
jgi:dinuclear metal center YbgI/SA1388 family protein